MAEQKTGEEDKESGKDKKKRFKRRWFIMGGILLLLLGARIWLPYYIKNELVASINDVEGYSCKLEDVDLALYKGQMVLEGLEVYITENDVQEPFVIMPETEIMLDWSGLFDGVLVGEVNINKPKLYFSDGSSDAEDQVGGASWTEPIIDFIPVKINELRIKDGIAEFENRDSKSNTKVSLHHIELVVKNVRNTTDTKNPLPSTLEMTSKVYKQGDLKVSGRLNILKEVPDMDLNVQASHIDLRQLNSIWETYASLDFESGTFGLASEYVMRNSEIQGYLKPIFDNVSIFSFKEDGTFYNKSWQAFAGFAMEVTENQGYNRSATKVPFSGTYQEPNLDVLRLVLNIFRNALFKAYHLEIEDTIGF